MSETIEEKIRWIFKKYNAEGIVYKGYLCPDIDVVFGDHFYQLQNNNCIIRSASLVSSMVKDLSITVGVGKAKMYYNIKRSLSRDAMLYSCKLTCNDTYKKIEISLPKTHTSAGSEGLYVSEVGLLIEKVRNIEKEFQERKERMKRRSEENTFCLLDLFMDDDTVVGRGFISSSLIDYTNGRIWEMDGNY